MLQSKVNKNSLKTVLLVLLFVSCASTNKGYLNDNTLNSTESTNKKDISLVSHINYTYETYISANKNYTTRLYLSHLIPRYFANSELRFENGKRDIEFTPETKKEKEQKITIKIISMNSYSGLSFSFIRRITLGHLSKKKKPRVLVIGDSVTDGYGANSNKKESWYPDQYWAFAKLYFEMEKIDDGDNPNEYNAFFLGGHNNGDFTIDYKGINRSVKAKAEGYGGAELQQLFEPVLGNAGVSNPFYDRKENTFSIQSYLAKYRTMDDEGERLVSSRSNPSGEAVVGTDGKTYVIGTEIKTQQLLISVDVCTPSIVVINLNHNTTLDNYKAFIGPTVRTLQKELPQAKIVIMTIDEAGTLFPADYPAFSEVDMLYKGLHEKNADIYNYVRDNIENEKEGVYVLAAQFVMPTAEGFPTIEHEGQIIQNPDVLGPHYHPNNRVHKAWGYTLYSMIKYLITD